MNEKEKAERSKQRNMVKKSEWKNNALKECMDEIRHKRKKRKKCSLKEWTKEIRLKRVNERNTAEKIKRKKKV